MLVGVPKEIKVHESRVAITPVASTYALTNATLPYALSLANHGWKGACAKDPNLAKGLNIHEGKIYYAAEAEAHGYSSVEL